MNNLNVEQVAYILKFLSRTDLDELMPIIIREYANKDKLNAINLINQISNLSAIVMKLTNEELNKSNNALHFSILYNQCSKNVKINTKKENELKAQIFAMLLPVIKVAFPEGKPDKSECQAAKEFFHEFLNYITDKKIFDIDKEADKRWAEMFDYTKYIVPSSVQLLRE